MTLTLSVRHSLLTHESLNILATKGRPDWLATACAAFSLKPTELKIGSVAISALAYLPDRGLFTPPLSLLRETLFNLGCDAADEHSLELYESRIGKTGGSLEITPGNITLRTAKAATVLNTQLVLINAYVIPPIMRQLLFSDPRITQLKDLSYCLKNPKTALVMRQKDLFRGAAKMHITAATIEFIAKRFLKMQKTLFDWLATDNAAFIDQVCKELTLIYFKDSKNCTLYAVYHQACWRGGYKKVHLAAKITSVIEPYGVAFCDDRNDFYNELRFRQIASLSPLFTQFDCYTRHKRDYIVPHTWANLGSLSSVIKTGVDPFYQHQLAKQLLQKMHLFHIEALHMDLHSQNLLVNYDGSFKIDLFINDVGGSVLKTDANAGKAVATQAAYLAPELLKRIQPHKGHYWNDVFDMDFTIQDRELSERFQVGLILYELYFGEKLYNKLITREQIRLSVPLYGLKFAQAVQSPHLFDLDRYLDDDQIADLETLFRDSFDKYYATLTYEPGMPFYPATLKKAPVEGLDDSEESEERRNELYDSIFEAHYKDPEKRFTMLRVANNDHVLDIFKIYNEAFREFKNEESTIQYKFYGKVMSELSRPIQELVPGILEEHGGIMEVFMPLLSLNPLERPTLDVILANLEAKLA